MCTKGKENFAIFGQKRETKFLFSHPKCENRENHPRNIFQNQELAKCIPEKCSKNETDNFFPSGNWIPAKTTVKYDKGAQHYLSVRRVGSRKYVLNV